VDVAKKYFILIEHENSNSQRSSEFRPYALCESDYYRRPDLLCHTCKDALRGSQVTANSGRYSMEQFSCAYFPMLFDDDDMIS
jgi:hypothetical protein